MGITQFLREIVLGYIDQGFEVQSENEGGTVPTLQISVPSNGFELFF